MFKKFENLQTFIFNQEFCPSMNHKIAAKKSLFQTKKSLENEVKEQHIDLKELITF